MENVETPYIPMSSVRYRYLRELIRSKKIGSTIKSTTNSRKVPYTTAYNHRKEIEEKSIIDEINRLNLTSDYGV